MSVLRQALRERVRCICFVNKVLKLLFFVFRRLFLFILVLDRSGDRRVATERARYDAQTRGSRRRSERIAGWLTGACLVRQRYRRIRLCSRSIEFKLDVVVIRFLILFEFVV